METYQFKPNGFFTWDSTLSNNEINVQFKLHSLTEDGSFECPRNGTYIIKADRASILKSKFILLQGDKVLGTATKKMFRLQMLLTFNNLEYTLNSKSWFKTAYTLKGDANTTLELSRDNILLRESTIRSQQEVPFALLGFFAWCTLYLRRRAARNNLSG